MAKPVQQVAAATLIDFLENKEENFLKTTVYTIAAQALASPSEFQA